MLKKSLVILIFALGLTVGFSARANDCPTDNGLGVGCNIGIGEYYCGGACRTNQPQCLTWTPSPICASIFTCNNFATADACGYGATCAGGYTRCGTWPNYNCTATIAPVSPCSTYDTCNNYCTGCISGYALCSATHTCVANPGCLPGQTFNACTATCEGTVSMLKLGYDSVSGTSVIQSAAYPTLFIPSSSNVGIGTSTPIAKLEVIPTSGYSILAGNFKIGNVALPTADSDAASKGYVDSVISSATSSITTLWGGTTGGDVWNLNSGNVGIGTTSPVGLLHLSSINPSLYTTDTDASTFEKSFGIVASNGAFKIRAMNDNFSGGRDIMTIDQNGVTTNYISFRTGVELERMRIDTAGNVGIGTTTPLAKLHISNGTPGLINPGTVPVTWIESSGTNYLGVYAPDALNSGIVFGSPTDGFGAAMYWNNNASLLTLSSQHTGASIAISSSNNSEAMRITSLGNVGIGTTTPLARLEVVPASGYSILAGNYKIGNVALPTADADAATKGYVDSTIASATSSIALWGGTTAGNVWNLNSGNVGIGTVSPGAKLEVFGRISQQGLGNNMFIGYNAGLNDNLDLGNRNMAIGYYALQANVSGVYNTAIGYWALTANTSSGNLAVGYQALKANTTGGNNTALGRDSLLANIGGGQNTAIGYAALLANTSGNNNMAIGHTALAGNTTGGYNTAIGLSAGRYQADGATALTDAENSVYIGSNTRGYDNSDSNSIVIGYNAIGVGVNSVVLGNDSITKTILKGNVGIGMTAPTQKLELGSGNILFDDINAKIYFGTGLANYVAYSGWTVGGYQDIILNQSRTGTPMGILFRTNNTDRMKIASDGNVGIGTTTPLAKLEVIPASGYSILAGNFKIGNVALPTADSDAATKGYVDSTVASATSSISSLWGGTTSGDIWSLNSGNVGIGTTTPVAKFHVEGTGNVVLNAGNVGIGETNPNYKLKVTMASGAVYIGNAFNYSPATLDLVVGSTSNSSRFLFGQSNSNFGGMVWNYNAIAASAYLSVGNMNGQNTAGLNILQNGNVGIGITNPGAHLQVGLLSSVGAGTPPTSVNLAGEYLHLGGSEWGLGYRAIGFGYVGASAVYSPAYIGFLETSVTNKTLGDLVFGTRNVTTDTLATEQMRITSAGNVGIGTTTPLARLEVVPASGYSILAGNYKIGNVASPTADSDVVTLGWVNSALASVGGVASYSTSTPATYSGSQTGYSGANALCAATVAGTHVCTTGEIFNTINTGGGAAIPAGSTFWVSNGPPAYTANANDCMGWTSAVGSDYGTVWIKLASGDGFGSLNACNVARSFACCQ